MTTFLHWGAGIILALHGLIHLLGFAAYLRLTTVAALPYKTAVLGGRLELGAAGMALFGLAWGVAALGLVAKLRVPVRFAQIRPDTADSLRGPAAMLCHARGPR